MFDWTEIWGIWILSQQLLLFVMFLNPFLNYFAVWQCPLSCWMRPAPSGNTSAMNRSATVFTWLVCIKVHVFVAEHITLTCFLPAVRPTSISNDQTTWQKKATILRCWSNSDTVSPFCRPSGPWLGSRRAQTRLIRSVFCIYHSSMKIFAEYSSSPVGVGHTCVWSAQTPKCYSY